MSETKQAKTTAWQPQLRSMGWQAGVPPSLEPHAWRGAATRCDLNNGMVCDIIPHCLVKCKRLSGFGLWPFQSAGTKRPRPKWEP
jgi:hypothetical protein